MSNLPKGQSDSRDYRIPLRIPPGYQCLAGGDIIRAGDLYWSTSSS
jgi:hypothetical protein